MKQLPLKKVIFDMNSSLHQLNYIFCELYVENWPVFMKSHQNTYENIKQDSQIHFTNFL